MLHIPIVSQIPNWRIREEFKSRVKSRIQGFWERCKMLQAKTRNHKKSIESGSIDVDICWPVDFSYWFLLISDNMFPPRFPKFLSVSVLVSGHCQKSPKQNSLEGFDTCGTCGCVLVTRIVTEVTDLQRNFSYQRKSHQLRSYAQMSIISLTMVSHYHVNHRGRSSSWEVNTAVSGN